MPIEVAVGILLLGITIFLVAVSPFIFLGWLFFGKRKKDE